MLVRSWPSPVLKFDSATCFFFSQSDITVPTRDNVLLTVNSSSSFQFQTSVIKASGIWKTRRYGREWITHSTAQIGGLTLSDEDRNKWESCRQALDGFSFSIEEQDRILGKAFGHLHSPYWGEERKEEVPKYEIINEILDYLRSLSLSDEDLTQLLKKFPEILGCSLEDELKGNVKILEKEWGVKGKSLKSLLLRNPKVLGYNVDCKGDCMAKCTRCWVRF